jgi:uncharacterized protein (DUF433 family)/predicted nucleotidyltransferase
MLTITPGVSGGRLCIAGTGVTVLQIVTLYKQGETPEEIALNFPHVSLAQIYAALAYYHSHQAEVERELAEEEAEYERLKQQHAQRTAMNDAPPIEEITDRIVAEFAPERVILFGSRARGDARADSDVDLFVEMATNLPPAERIRAVDRLFRPRSWPMDVVVLTPEEAAASRASRNSLVRVAEREGKVVYERS